MNMPHQCQCSSCQQVENPTQELHRCLNYLLSVLDDRQRRLFVGLEAKRRGPGGERAVALITGWEEAAVAVALRELDKAVAPERDEPSNVQAALDAKLRVAQETRANALHRNAYWQGSSKAVKTL
jgi:hypothetical protein